MKNQYSTLVYNSIGLCEWGSKLRYMIALASLCLLLITLPVNAGEPAPPVLKNNNALQADTTQNKAITLQLPAASEFALDTNNDQLGWRFKQTSNSTFSISEQGQWSLSDVLSNGIQTLVYNPTDGFVGTASVNLAVFETNTDDGAVSSGSVKVNVVVASGLANETAALNPLFRPPPAPGTVSPAPVTSPEQIPSIVTNNEMPPTLTGSSSLEASTTQNTSITLQMPAVSELASDSNGDKLGWRFNQALVSTLSTQNGHWTLSSALNSDSQTLVFEPFDGFTGTSAISLVVYETDTNQQAVSTETFTINVIVAPDNETKDEQLAGNEPPTQSSDTSDDKAVSITSPEAADTSDTLATSNDTTSDTPKDTEVIDSSEPEDVLEEMVDSEAVDSPEVQIKPEVLDAPTAISGSLPENDTETNTALPAPDDQLEAPDSLSFQVLTPSSVRLSWNKPTSNNQGFNIYRDGCYRETVFTNQWQDDSAQHMGLHTYQVAAFNGNGYYTPLSQALLVDMSVVGQPPMSLDKAVPSIPTALRAIVINENSVRLNWEPSSDDFGVFGYNVYRNNNYVGTSFSNQFEETNLPAAKSITYSVTAYDGSENYSVHSDNLSVDLSIITRSEQGNDTLPPTTPLNLQLFETPNKMFNLSWEAANDNVEVTGYKVFRNGCQYLKTSDTFITDSAVEVGFPYEYTVVAIDAVGNQSGHAESVLPSLEWQGL